MTKKPLPAVTTTPKPYILREIEIENYRSLRSVKLHLREYIALIGPNSAGKSNILKALNLFLSDDNAIGEDYYIDTDGTAAREIVITCLLTAESRDDIRIRKTYKSKAKVSIEELGKSDDLWSKVAASSVPLPKVAILRAGQDYKNTLSDKDAELKGLLKLVIAQSILTKNNTPTHWHTAKQSFDALFSGEFSTSPFQAVLDDVAQNVSDTLSENWPDHGITLSGSGEGGFEEFLVSKITGRVLNPQCSETNQSVSQQGHGLQRSISFSLIHSLLRKASQEDSSNFIFLIEEPELFLHPQAQKALSSTLHDCASPNSQIVVASHSAKFISFKTPEEVVIVKKLDGRTAINQMESSNLASDDKQIFKDAQKLDGETSEMLFARRVILVEGATEKTVWPILAKKMGVFDVEVSVVNCGGVENIPSFARLAENLGIEYIVVHDKDKIPEQTSRNKRVASAVQTGALVVLNTHFEAVARYNNGTQKESKPELALNWAERLDLSEIPPNIVRLIKTCYGAFSAERFELK